MMLKNFTQTLGMLSKLSKQTRFATAQALNDTAKDVQSGELKNLGQKFTLRAKGAPWQKPGTKFGINIRPFATKARLEARIGSQFEPLKLHEKGGAKTTAGHRLAIPSPQHKPKSAIMARAKKPRAMRARGAFEAKGALWKRVGKARFPIQYLFTLERSARIRPTLNFEGEGRAVAQRRYRMHFDKRLTHAILTAR